MTHTADTEFVHGPVVFGEVLHDIFPDGTAVLGGAPFNVAWHLQRYECAPLPVSRIGNDPHGKYILKAMQEREMPTQAVQIDSYHATGMVTVELEQAQPRFNNVANQAYAFIETEEAVTAISKRHTDLPYHGCLCLRKPISRHTLRSLRDVMLAPRFVDVNFRALWRDRDSV